MKNDPMKPQVQPPLFFETLIRRNRTTWSWAVAGARPMRASVVAAAMATTRETMRPAERETLGTLEEGTLIRFLVL